MNKVSSFSKSGYTNEDYDINDIIHILQYYAQNEVVPEFYSFDYIEKNKVDPCVIAQHIVDEKLDPVSKAAYINELWNNGEENLRQSPGCFQCEHQQLTEHTQHKNQKNHSQHIIYLHF